MNLLTSLWWSSHQHQILPSLHDNRLSIMSSKRCIFILFNTISFQFNPFNSKLTDISWAKLLVIVSRIKILRYTFLVFYHHILLQKIRFVYSRLPCCTLSYGCSTTEKKRIKNLQYEWSIVCRGLSQRNEEDNTSTLGWLHRDEWIYQ